MTPRPLRPGPDHAAALPMGMLFGALMGGPAVHELLYRLACPELRRLERWAERAAIRAQGGRG